MNDPTNIDNILATGASVAGGGGLVGFLVRFLFNGVSKRLDNIDAHLREQRKEITEMRKEQNVRYESTLERIVKAETKAQAAHARIDALCYPLKPKQRKK